MRSLWAAKPTQCDCLKRTQSALRRYTRFGSIVALLTNIELLLLVYDTSSVINIHCCYCLRMEIPPYVALKLQQVKHMEFCILCKFAVGYPRIGVRVKSSKFWKLLEIQPLIIIFGN